MISFPRREVILQHKLLRFVQAVGSNTENCPSHPFQHMDVDDSELEPILKRLLA